jgi:SAM-dependent methyltransferase
MGATETGWYEERQNHNAITRWLHSFRYRYAIDTVDRIYERLRRPLRIVDVGCGNGKLFDALHFGRPIEYTGIEPDLEFAETAKSRHARYKNFRLIQESAVTAFKQCESPDLVMVLETFEHIPEGQVVRLVEDIAAARPACFFASVPVEIGPAIWMKNVGSLVCGYMRHREYTWPETLWAGLYQLDKLPPHGTLHKGFDWRWLAQTIRQNMKITGFHRFPLPFMPAAVSSSVCFVAEPRVT